MKLFPLLIFVLVVHSLSGQSLYTAFQLNRPEEFRNNKFVLEIEEENTFITSSGKEIARNRKVLNQNNMVVTEERFDEAGKLKERLTRGYDSLQQKIVSRKFERWHPLLGYSMEVASYEYDGNGNLIKMTDQTATGQILRQAILTSDEKGYPLTLELYDGNGNLFGTEVAAINYSTNKALIKVKDNKGNILSSDSTTIDFTKSPDLKRPGEVFNDYGDLVRSPRYQYEWEYDAFRNWTSKKIYKMVNGKKKKDRIFKRKIKYATITFVDRP